MDRPLPLWVRLVLILLCALIPTAFVAKQYENRHDLTQLILFGENDQARELPEVKALKPAVDSPGGFDGQFYAQIAIDPSLNRFVSQKVIEHPYYRCQRIVLPALAYVLGHGSPPAILRAYALLNLPFWYVLFASLLWWVRAVSARSLLVVFAIVLTTGSLISIQRSLTDLPTATLGFLSLSLSDLPAALLISIAILTKPTAGLFLTRYLLPLPKTLAELTRKAGAGLLALVLPALWIIYLHYMIMDRGSKTGKNLAFPFSDWSQRIVTSWQEWASMPVDFQPYAITHWEWNLFEFLALMSMTFQAAFLLLRPRWNHPVWIMGSGFAVLFFCLSTANFVEQIAYTRTALPLTIAFNLLLLESKRGPLFFLYFIAGNIGLLCSLHDMLGFLMR